MHGQQNIKICAYVYLFYTFLKMKGDSLSNQYCPIGLRNVEAACLL